MANEDLSIQLQVNFEDYNKIENKLKSKISELEKNVSANIKFDSSQIVQFESQLNKIKDELSKYKLQFNLDDSQINKVNNQTLGLLKNINSLSQRQVTIVDDKATKEVEKINNNLVETSRIIYDLNKNSIKEVVTQDYGKAQKELYRDLNSLQNEEFTIKRKLIGADEEKTSELQKQLSLVNEQKNRVGENIVTYNLKNDDKNKELLESRNKLQSELNIKSLEYNKNEQRNSDEIRKQIDLYKQRKEIDIQNLNTRYGKLVDKDVINEFRNSLSEIDPKNFNIKEFETQFKGIESNIKATSNALKLTQKDAESLGDSFSRSAQQFLQWYVVGNFIQELPAKFQEATNFVKEFDKELNQISIVTGQLNLSGLSNELSKLGNDLSTTQKDMATGATEFYRQGLGQAQVLDRLVETTKFAKISNLQFKESAELLTATVNSMNVPIQKATDVFAYLGDATATGSDEVAKAVSKVAGTASVAQLSLEKIGSWTAVISSKTREASETIGFSLQSIMSRYMSIKEKGFNQEDSTKINDVTKALTSIGIQATDSQGQLRNFGNIMDELGAKFNTLSNNQKAYITTTLAGTRQGSRLNVLLSDYSQSMDLYNKALQATGTTQQKFNIYQEGVQAHLDKLANTKQDVFKNLISSESFKTFIDFGNNALQVINSLIKSVGSFGVALATVSGAMGIFKKDFSLLSIGKNDKGVTQYLGAIPSLVNGISSSFGTWGKKWDELNQKSMYMNGQFNAMPSTITRVGNGFKALGSSIAGSAIAMGALNMAINMAIGFGVGLLLQGVVKVIDSIIHRQENLKKANEEVLQSYQSATKTYSDTLSYLNEEGSQYDKLRNKVYLTTEEQTKLNQIREKIASQFPEFINGYDNEGKVILDNTKTTKDYIEALKERQKLENDKLISKGGDILKGSQEGIDEYNKKITEINGNIKVYDRYISSTKEKIAKLNEEQLKQEEGIKLTNELRDYEIKRAKTLKSLSVEQANVNTEMDKLKPIVSAIINNYDGLNDASKKAIQGMIKITPKDIIDLKDGDITGLTVKINEMVKKINPQDLEKIQVLIESKPTSPSQIATTVREYMELVKRIAESTGKTPLEITKLFPLKSDPSKIKPVVDGMIKDIQNQINNATNEADKINLNSMLKGLQDVKTTVTMDVKGTENVEDATNKMSSLKEIEIETMKAVDEVKNEYKEINQVLDQHAKSGKVFAVLIRNN